MTHDPHIRRVGATDFKQQCLTLLDDVSRTGRSLIVTKHGRPVARVVPIDSPKSGDFFGSVTLVAEQPEAYYSADDRWESEEP